MPTTRQNKAIIMSNTPVFQERLRSAKIEYPARTWRRAMLAASLLAIWPVCSYGLGFRIPNQDAEAIARGNAFVATADNPAAIYYNPAGITQLEGHTAQFGIHSLSAN